MCSFFSREDLAVFIFFPVKRHFQVKRAISVVDISQKKLLIQFCLKLQTKQCTRGESCVVLCSVIKSIYIYVAASQLKFTSQYQGNTKTALAGSSVNFTWNFSGGSDGVDRVSWGLTKRGAIDFINNGMLVSLDPSSGLSVSVPVPAEYSGRINGSVTGNKFSGQAIFKLSSIKKFDERFYGCRVDPVSDFDSHRFDTVYLVVQGG